jgi:hypothetical protein
MVYATTGNTEVVHGDRYIIQWFCIKEPLGFSLFYGWSKGFISQVFVKNTSAKLLEGRINIKLMTKLEKCTIDIYRM